VRRVLPQLLTDHPVGLLRPGRTVERTDVDQVQQDARPLDVPQEGVAQPDAFVSTLNQTGNIRHDKPAVAAQLDDPKLRLKRRERIIGDLGPRAA